MITNEKINQDFDKLKNCFACDTETAMIPDAYKGRKNIRLIQFKSYTHLFYYDLSKFSDDNWATLKERMENPECKIIFHNAIFDIRVLKNCAIYLQPENIECTLLQSSVIYNGKLGVSHSLAEVTKRRLGEVLDKTHQTQDWINADLTGEEIRYAMNDVRCTWLVYWDMIGQIIEDKLEIVYEIEKLVIPAIIQMEEEGIKVDTDAVNDLIEELAVSTKEYQECFIEELHGALLDNNLQGLLVDSNGVINRNKTPVGSKKNNTYEPAGFNPRSPRQVLKHFNSLGIEPMDDEGKSSLNQNLLTQFEEYPIVRTYLKWKVKDKLLQMLISLQKHVDIENDRIHPSFRQNATFTGRLSCSSPNLQNIPRDKDFRRLFIAEANRVLMAIDYRTMELAALCSVFIADEPKMRKAINDDEDIHKLTASLMFECELDEVTKEQRQNAKAVNFGAAYGSSTKGLVNYFLGLGKIISHKQGEEFLNAWHKSYPAIGEWHKKNRERVKRGEPVRMVDLRRRYLSGKSAKHTTMSNNQVQGSCASVVKIAMSQIVKRLPDIDPSARLVCQVHDEILVECAVLKSVKVLNTCSEIMSLAGKEVFGDSVKFTADGSIGLNWQEAKE